MYADMLQHQQNTGRNHLGINLSYDRIDDFSQEQLGQLYALQQEATSKTHENNSDQSPDKT